MVERWKEAGVPELSESVGLVYYEPACLVRTPEPKLLQPKDQGGFGPEDVEIPPRRKDKC